MVYKIKEFAKLCNVSLSTLRSWDKNGVLKANRTPTNRRYYTDDHYEIFKNEINLDLKTISLNTAKEIFKNTYKKIFYNHIGTITQFEKINYTCDEIQKELPTKIDGSRVQVNVIETTIQYMIVAEKNWYIFQICKVEYFDKDFKNEVKSNILDVGNVEDVEKLDF